jgi:hypothetical protein
MWKNPHYLQGNVTTTSEPEVKGESKDYLTCLTQHHIIQSSPNQSSWATI